MWLRLHIKIVVIPDPHHVTSNQDDPDASMYTNAKYTQFNFPYMYNIQTVNINKEDILHMEDVTRLNLISV